MIRYLSRKLVIYLLTFWVAVTIDWAIPRFMPGNPVEGLLSRMHAQPESQACADGLLQQGLRLRRPALEAVPQLLGRALPRRPRVSIANFPTPVWELIRGAVPYTLALLVPAILLSFWAGNKFGALAARRKVLDNTVFPPPTS